MDFTGIKTITIPEGVVAKIAKSDTTLWEFVKQKVFTNVLPLATDEDRKTIYNGKGYITGYRVSGSSGALQQINGMCASGFIFPVKVGDIIRIKGTKPKQGASSYVVAYDSSNARVGHISLMQEDNGSAWVSKTNMYCPEYQDNIDGVLTITLRSEDLGTGFDAIRFSAGTIDENTIVTINEEITA